MHQAVPAGSVVAVTGASGFVGRHVVKELLARGFKVRALVRERESARGVLPAAPGAVTLVQGDATDSRVVDDLLAGGGARAGACIHLIGIIRQAHGTTFRKAHVETTRSVIEGCRRAGVDRYVHMSALGVSHEGTTAYQKTKWEAEIMVRASGLDWTIFRPGMILGPGSKFLEMAKGWVSGEAPPYFFIPFFSRAVPDTRVPLGPMNRQDPVVQPVFVGDVAEAFVGALLRPGTIGEIYNLVGPDVMSWPALLTKLRDEIPSGTDTLHPFGVPSKQAAAIARAAKWVGLGDLLPFDEGMAVMGGQDSTAEVAKVRAHLGLSLRGVDETLPAYAASV
ncbi:MAG: NAD(P)H-binding protein [Phycisphaerales bacterium]|nr:NAD(P)H-binding protein [Phycisphaerales bacterium]